MNLLRRLRLAPRMALGFGSLLLLLVAIVAIAFFGFERSSAASRQLHEEEWVKSEAASNLEPRTRANARPTIELVIT